MHNPFARFFRARDKPSKQASPQDAVSAAPGFYYGTSLAGKSVTPTSAIQVSAVSIRSTACCTTSRIPR